MAVRSKKSSPHSLESTLGKGTLLVLIMCLLMLLVINQRKLFVKNASEGSAASKNMSSDKPKELDCGKLAQSGDKFSAVVDQKKNVVTDECEFMGCSNFFN